MYRRIEHNIGLGWEMGLAMPELKVRKMLSVDDFESMDDSWVLDPSGEVFVQHVSGVDVSYSQFFNGDKFSCFTTMINDRAMLNGGQGIKLDSNCITAFADAPAFLKSCLAKMKVKLKEYMPDFMGFVIVDVTLKDGRPYYRAINFTTKLDYLNVQAELNGLEVEDMVAKIEAGVSLPKPEGFASSLKLYVYPYDVRTNLALRFPMSKMDINFKLGDEGLNVVSTGNTIARAWKNLYHKIPEGVEKYACFRLDGDVEARRSYNIMMRNHYHENPKNRGKNPMEAMR